MTAIHVGMENKQDRSTINAGEVAGQSVNIAQDKNC
jgi:hypothetical protein